ncbi:MAG: lipopolysaccharide assembly protein LapA domain-containing protein [Elusimicrobiota bacterium]
MGNKGKLIAILVLAIAIAVLVIQNMALVQVRFLWWLGELPVALLLFLSAAGGFIIGVSAALFTKSVKK